MKETRTTTNAWQQYKAIASGKKTIFQKSVMLIFGFVAAALLWIARKLHLTY